MTPSTDAPTWDRLVPVYEQLLKYSAPLSFPPPWDFIPAQPQCVGPVADPTAVLADLLARFGEGLLRAARILSTPEKAAPQLSPLFTGPDSVVIALRNPLDGPLVGLLTSHGCFPAGKLETVLVLQDDWTRTALLPCGVLCATPDIREVALLRALGMPATLSRQLQYLTNVGLQGVNKRFVETPRAGSRASRPLLALVGWSMLSPSTQPSPALLAAVEHLARARQYLDLELAGICAWRLSAEDIDRVRYLLKVREAGGLRTLLREGLDELDDFSTLLPRGAISIMTDADRGAEYVKGRAELLGYERNPPTYGFPCELAQRTKERYEEMVQQELIEPLIRWAMASADPIIRCAGVELASVCEMLHRMGQLLLTQQVLHYDRAKSGMCEPLPAEALKQYLGLMDRFTNLVRDLSEWRRE